MEKVQYAEGEYYHIYNRGVDKQEIFLNLEEIGIVFCMIYTN